MSAEQSRTIRKVGRIRKGDDTGIIVEVREFKDRRYADIRHVVVDHRGRDIPKTGMTIGARQIALLIEYLQEAERLLNPRPSF